MVTTAIVIYIMVMAKSNTPDTIRAQQFGRCVFEAGCGEDRPLYPVD